MRMARELKFNLFCKLRDILWFFSHLLQYIHKGIVMLHFNCFFLFFFFSLPIEKEKESTPFFVCCVCLCRYCCKRNGSMIFLFLVIIFFRSFESGRFTWNASPVATSGSLASYRSHFEHAHKRNCELQQKPNTESAFFSLILILFFSISALSLLETKNFGFGKGIRKGHSEYIYSTENKEWKKAVLNVRYK